MCLFQTKVGKLTELHGRIGFRISRVTTDNRFRLARQGLGSVFVKMGKLYSPYYSSTDSSWDTEINQATPINVKGSKGISLHNNDGFHIWKRNIPVDSRSAYSFGTSHALITVAMFGRAFDHGNGYRVSTAIIQQIFLHPGASKSLIASVKKNYPLAEIGMLKQKKTTFFGCHDIVYYIN